MKASSFVSNKCILLKLAELFNLILLLFYCKGGKLNRETSNVFQENRLKKLLQCTIASYKLEKYIWVVLKGISWMLEQSEQNQKPPKFTALDGCNLNNKKSQSCVLRAYSLQNLIDQPYKAHVLSMNSTKACIFDN